MRHRQCTLENEVLEATRSEELSEELNRHIASCRSCADAVSIERLLQEEARTRELGLRGERPAVVRVEDVAHPDARQVGDVELVALRIEAWRREALDLAHVRPQLVQVEGAHREPEPREPQVRHRARVRALQAALQMADGLARVLRPRDLFGRFPELLARLLQVLLHLLPNLRASESVGRLQGLIEARLRRGRLRHRARVIRFPAIQAVERLDHVVHGGPSVVRDVQLGRRPER